MKRPHINESGEFQSDKYPTCPAGKVPLSVKDPTAQDLLYKYADRRRSVDEDFARDLQTCLRDAGYTGPAGVRTEVDTAALRALRVKANAEGSTWNECMNAIRAELQSVDALIDEVEELRDRVANEVEYGKKRFVDAHEALIAEVTYLRRRCKESQRALNVELEWAKINNDELDGVSALLNTAASDLKALRAVPTPEASSVCSDDDWEHLARLRGRHINACYQRMMTARKERDDAVQTIAELKKSHLEQLTEIVNLWAKRYVEVQKAAIHFEKRWVDSNQEAENFKKRWADTESLLGQAKDAQVQADMRGQGLEKALRQALDNSNEFSQQFAAARNRNEELTHKLNRIRDLLK